MIIETIERLLNSDLSAYYIHQKTGMTASSIQRLRSGERQLNKLTLDSTDKEKGRDFVESGGKYDHNEYDWGQPVGRELW